MASHASNFTSSACMMVREVFSRLVFSLQIDPSLSMKITAFWLWLERSGGHTDLIESIFSFDDMEFEAIAFTAKSFVETLSPGLSDLYDGSTQRNHFQKQLIEGVSFFLKNVCYQVLEDIRQKAQKEFAYKQIHQDYEEYLDRVAPVNAKDLLSRIKSLYANTEEHVGGSSSGSIQLPTTRIHQNIREESMNEYQCSRPDLTTMFDNMSLGANHNNDASMQQHYDEVPPDDRTLFLTFSNGYPFSEDELYDFFTRHYGDVQEITIEDPQEPRPPVFARLTFFSQLTLLRVLDGNRRVKFITRGKHLWARKFIPKGKKNDEPGAVA